MSAVQRYVTIVSGMLHPVPENADIFATMPQFVRAEDYDAVAAELAEIKRSIGPTLIKTMVQVLRELEQV